MKRSMILVILAALAACSSSSNATLSEADTSAALGVMTAASSVGVSAATMASYETGETTVTATGACPEGGNVEATGMIQADAEGQTFALDLTYVACIMGDITMDGVLDYTGSYSQGGMSISMSGEVTFGGLVEGTCSIDIQMSSDTSQDSLTIEGNACGNDVSAEYGPNS